MADADVSFAELPYDVLASSTDREAWLAARRELITASDVSAVLGLHPGVTALELYETAVNPWAGPLTVYARKAGLMAELEETEAMRFGTLLEPIIIDEYARRTGHVVRPAGELLRSRAHPWLGATLDAEILMPFSAALECKAVGLDKADAWEKGPPPYYVAQVQAQMLVTGHERAVVAVLIGGQRLEWFDVGRDSEMQARIVESTRDFMRRMRESDPPPPSGSRDDGEALTAMFGSEVTGVSVELPSEAARIDARINELTDRIRSDCQERDALKQQVQQWIGKATYGHIGNGYSFKWATEVRGPYSVERKGGRVLRRVKTPKANRSAA